MGDTKEGKREIKENGRREYKKIRMKQICDTANSTSRGFVFYKPTSVSSIIILNSFLLPTVVVGTSHTSLSLSESQGLLFLRLEPLIQNELIVLIIVIVWPLPYNQFPSVLMVAVSLLIFHAQWARIKRRADVQVNDGRRACKITETLYYR